MTSLGVDLGATWLRAGLYDDKIGKIKTRRRPAVALEDLPRSLARLFPRTGGGSRPHRLVIGARGVWTAQERTRLQRSLHRIASRVRVFSDLELAHTAAFAGGPGVLILAGTGAAALALGPHGRVRRAGGLGPLLGDEGSAFWLGRQASRDPSLRRLIPKADPLRLAHAADPVRATAALAPQVLALSPRVSSARRLRAEAAVHLSRLVTEAADTLGFHGSIPVCWQGGLFADEGLREDFRRLIEKRRFRLGPPLLDPHTAAAVLTGDLLWRIRARVY